METIEIDLSGLPEDARNVLRTSGFTSKMKEAAVMELLRGNYITQGQAAEALEIPRSDLFDLMTRYEVPVIDMDREELKDELNKKVTPGKGR
jgi:predicted XRE-type DNA-binding protein